MKLYKYLALFVTFLGASNGAFAQNDGEHTHHEEDVNTRDLQALRTFVNEKRAIDLKDKATNLSISGDVRTEWRHMREKYRGHQVRGGHATDCHDVILGKNDFDIEFNLRFDYETDRAWAYAHVQYDNSAGIDRMDCDDCFKDRFHGNGMCDGLCLKRAYMGYNVFNDKCGGGSFDIEIGRQTLYDAFESEIEFDSRMDGIIFVYENKWEYVAEWYAQVAGFLVDERTNQFAYAAELAFFNIYDSGFDVKYSFIDWTKRGRDRCDTRNPPGFKFANSQVVLTYHLDPELFCLPIEIYGAALYNHTARQVRLGDNDEDRYYGGDISRAATSDISGSSISGSGISEGSRHHNFSQRKRWGFYAGITFGEVEFAGDWCLDIQYQYVGKYAVAYDDQSGIGIGNVLADCCGKHRQYPTTGYRGWRFDALYAVTDELTLQAIIEWSTSKSMQKTQHNYSKVELEAVYAF